MTRKIVGLSGAVLLGLALVFFIVMAKKGEDQGANLTDAKLVSAGEQVYRDHCASCHGANLEGQPDWQARKKDGRLPAPPHDETGHTWHHPDDALFRIIKEGVSGIVPGYESDMPAYGDKLTEQEIWAVLSFIKSRWPRRIQETHANINRRAHQK